MPDLPKYGVRASGQLLGQPKALTWLTQGAKDTFFVFQSKALAKWGVSPDHDGTCVMDPADWANLDPLELMQTFDHRTSPTAHSQNRVSNGVYPEAGILTNKTRYLSTTTILLTSQGLAPGSGAGRIRG